MYILMLIAFPVLFLISPYLALAGLIAAIVGMYFQRTRPSKRPGARPSESAYKAGYED